MEQTIEDAKKKPYNYKWTLEALQADAKKYKSKSEWQKNSAGGYRAAQRRGWIDLCCAHMVEIKKPNGYWNLKRCKADAKKYKTKVEWKTIGGSAYVIARANGWLEQCCAHMVVIKKPDGYWNLKRCKAEAKKYKTKIDWVRNSSASYDAAKRLGIVDQCCAHMKELLYWGPRVIREFLFAAGIDHKIEKKFPDLRDIKELPFDFYLPKYHLVIEYHGAQHREGHKGFKGKCNALLIKHDKMKKEYCRTKQIYYIAICEWKVKESQDVINKIIRKINRINALNGLEAQSFKELKPLTKKQQSLCEDKAYWTLERCIADAKKYKTRGEWQKNSSGAYAIAYKNKWMNQCCGHMAKPRKPRGYWTLGRCITDAKKYKTRNEWREKSSGAYQMACINDWLAQCCEHMVSPCKPSGYWTFENIVASTKDFIHKSYAAWKKANKSAYSALLRLKRTLEVRALFN